jgi:hypothetical protein
MNNEREETLKPLPNSGRCQMPNQKLYKAGDTFVIPVTFQVLKTLGHEDRVFHICAPADDVKHLMCLSDPFFVACLENDEADLPVIPDPVLQRAHDFVSVDSESGEDADGFNEGDDSDEGGN